MSAVFASNRLMASPSTFTQDVTIDVVPNGFPGAPERLSCSGMTATGILDGNTLTVSDDQGETLVFRR